MSNISASIDEMFLRNLPLFLGPLKSRQLPIQTVSAIIQMKEKIASTYYINLLMQTTAGGILRQLTAFGVKNMKI